MQFACPLPKVQFCSHMLPLYSFYMDVNLNPTLFLFQGFMEFSYLFYGYYSNIRMEDRDVSYDIPLAYLFTAVFYFIFCLICIMARSVPALMLLLLLKIKYVYICVTL